MRFHAGLSTNKKPCWWLFGENGEQVGWSGRIFESVDEATAEAQAFKENAATAMYDIYLDDAEKPRWRAYVDDVRVASSGESFASRSNAQRAAENVRDNAGAAEGP